MVRLGNPWGGWGESEKRVNDRGGEVGGGGRGAHGELGNVQQQKMLFSAFIGQSKQKMCKFKVRKADGM